MEGAQHLLGERGGDSGLCIAALFQERWETPVATVGEQADLVQVLSLGW
jgi:hypothetical protein